jgi:hypothetical protein
MTIYACKKCVEEHSLPAENWHGVACCEICGELKNDWEYKSLVLVPVIRRFEPIEPQLKNRD